MKFLNWTVITLVACLGMTGCESDDEAENNDPCSFATNGNADLEVSPVWTGAELVANSSAVCPAGDADFLANLNSDEEEEPEDDLGDECDPSQDNTALECTYSFACDPEGDELTDLSGAFTVSETGSVIANFSMTLEGIEGTDEPIVCEYNITGEFDLPE